jgi:8-oxo-dGTP pyrophosphatase MutT (NUDIX family)
MNNKCLIQEGKEYWISRSVAVVAVVIVYVINTYSMVYDIPYLLIAKRGKGAADYQGLWNLPCGYLDWNETALEACKREIFEETGLDINNYKFEEYDEPFSISTDPSDNKQNVSLRYLFDIEITEEEFNKMKEILNTNNSEENEVEEIKFIKLEDYINYEFAFNHEKIIKLIK